jgi:hypothetical protein
MLGCLQPVIGSLLKDLSGHEHKYGDVTVSMFMTAKPQPFNQS